MNRPFQKDDEEEADSGIGTMIVFIGMTIVAVISAGVFVNLAYDFSEQAANTADEALNQVTSGYQTLSIVGDRKEDAIPGNPESSEIQVLDVVIQLVAGSPSLDIGDTVIEIASGEAVYILTHDGTGTTAADATDATFVTEEIRENGDSYDILQQGDLLKIIISTDSSAADISLGTSTEASIRLMPQVGLTTFENFITPSAFTDRYLILD